MPPGSDRALHDALIRLLADAPFRIAVHAGQARAPDDLPAEHAAILRGASPDRVRRFARFLARGYYHERIAHFYKYSRALARWTGRRDADVLRSAGFTALLDTIVLGSRDSARAVSALTEAHLADAPNAPPYWADLLRYESAQMITEAGPRVWRSAAPPARITPTTVAAPNTDTQVLDFEWDLPSVLPALLALASAQPAPVSPPPAEHRPTRLLFARTPRGRVTVMRWNGPLADLVAAMDGARELSDVAAAAGLPARDVVEITAALAESGVVHVA